MKFILEQYKDFLMIEKGLCPVTVQGYSYIVKDFLSKYEIDRENIKLYYRARMENNAERNTLRNVSAALNHLASMNKIDLHIKPPKKPKKMPFILTEEEMINLLDMMDELTYIYPDNLYYARDRAIIYLLATVGLRCSETCFIKMADLDLRRRLLHVYDSKNQKYDISIMCPGCADAIRDYIAVFKAKRYELTEYLFPSRKSNRIRRNQIIAIVKKYAERAGIEKEVYPHLLRHSLGTLMRKKGADAIDIKEQLRHRTLLSTMIYMHTTWEDRQKRYDKIITR